MLTGFGRIGKVLTAVVFAAALTLPSVASAQDAELAPYEPGTDLGSLSGTISADGSSTVGPLTEAFAEDFAPQAPNVQITVDISGTGGGFKRFCAGETDIQNASRAISEEEIATCEAAGVDYYLFQMAYDGISVVVNAENDFVSCLTVDQLGQLWAPDSTVSTWADLNPEWPAEEIALYGPGPDSGTFDYFTEEIVGEGGASRTDYTPSEDDNTLVAGVSGDANALGYFGFSYYEQNQDVLNLVAIDNGGGCVAPSPETISDGTYAPLSRPLYIYVKAESFQRPEIQEFMRFAIATSPALAGEVGYVAAPVEAYVADQEKVEAIIAGTATPDSQAAPAADATPAT